MYKRGEQRRAIFASHAPPPLPMRCIIVEDDPLSRVVLEGFVARHADLDLAASCAGLAEAAAALQRGAVDLVLLDVGLPEGSGLDLVSGLPPGAQVIVVTGEERHAADAFAASAADYLLKPVAYDRFERAVERARRLAAGDAPEDHSPAALPDGPVFVRSEGRLVRVDLREVDYVAAEKDYVAFHLGERAHRVHGTMKQMARKLPAERFARIHRSFIVRLDRVEDVSDQGVRVGAETLPVSASYRDAFVDRLRML